MNCEHSTWSNVDEGELAQAREFAQNYRAFLSNVKTERTAVDFIVSEARKFGFKSLNEFSCLKQGDKVYYGMQNKTVCLAVIGAKPMTEGLKIIGSHLDSPRLDLKQNPVYEDGALALFKTHYYGGIKKYQWTSVPLALNGVVVTGTGEKIVINIGDAPGEPVFMISDLLPHLAKEQMDKKARDVVKGEGLNIIAGSIPCSDSEVKERIKSNLLDILQKRYGITEEDFVSAELEAVPAGQARFIGFDEGMIGGYGQDDRACVYTSLRAILQANSTVKTAVALFTDKEETGSDGATGMKSHFFEDFLAELIYLQNDGNYDGLSLRRTLRHSKALSADCTVAFDPNFPDVTDKYNTACLGGGVVISKYSGIGGKYDTSDTGAEFVGEIRRIFKQANISWQTGELGKVDQGGGGTIAQYLACYGMEVLDCGPAMLSLHSPFEMMSVIDLFMTYKAYFSFYNM